MKNKIKKILEIVIRSGCWIYALVSVVSFFCWNYALNTYFSLGYTTESVRLDPGVKAGVCITFFGVFLIKSLLDLVETVCSFAKYKRKKEMEEQNSAPTGKP